MQITGQTPPLFSAEARNARSLVKTITPEGMTLTPEKTEEEQRLESSTLSFQRQLTPEEENRVLFLQNLLAQMLTLSDGQPTEEQCTRIREIEKELEKITGVKVRSSLSSASRNMPGKKKDDDKDDNGQNVDGINPKEAVHNRQAESGKSTNPGMQLLQGNATFFKLNSLLDNSKSPLSHSGTTS